MSAPRIRLLITVASASLDAVLATLNSYGFGLETLLDPESETVGEVPVRGTLPEGRWEDLGSIEGILTFRRLPERPAPEGWLHDQQPETD